MERWHANTLAIFDDPRWKLRDQGTLAATVWQMGLQDQPTLPHKFNFIVDPMSHLRFSKRKMVRVADFHVDNSYSLAGDSRSRPLFLHFVNGGLGKRGWKNWDNAEELLRKGEPTPPVKVGPKERVSSTRKTTKGTPRLSRANRVVHGLWIGNSLSKMELLTLRSFIRHGHEFHLWLYEKLETPVPKEVIIEDANKIIPKRKIFRKADNDPEIGLGKGSFSSPFSDLFRYKLLYMKGGYWVDMDVTCLRPLNFAEPYVFRPHRVGVVGNVMKCPPRSRLMKSVYRKVAREANAHSEWLMPNRVLSQAIIRFGLSRYIRKGIWNEESWWDAIRPLALGKEPVPSEWHVIHWINEFWRTLKRDGGHYRGRRLFDIIPDKEHPTPGSALAQLYESYSISSSPVVQPEPIKPPALKPEPVAAPAPRSASRQPTMPHFSLESHINVLLPSLARAEPSGA